MGATMTTPSPFQVARETATNLSNSFSRVRDENAIESILSQAMNTGDPAVVQNSIGKILSQVSPERQGAAVQYLQSTLSGIEKKKQQAKAEEAGREYGINPNLPPQVQSAIYTQGQKNQRQQNELNALGLSSSQSPQQNAPSPGSPLDTSQANVSPQQGVIERPLANRTDDELTRMQALPGIGGKLAKAEAEQRRFEKGEKRKDKKEINESYKQQKDFIDNTTAGYRGFESDIKPRLLQMQNMKPEEIVGPTAAKFLETIGIPLGALENPSSELYQKLSQDLLKGLPETYGNRILKVEVDNFLRTIPQLLNSPDGRRMIASNMLKLGEMKEIFYNEMRRQQQNIEDSGKEYPRDFEQKVFDQVKPQIDKFNNEFMRMSEVTSIPPNTIPFFNPQGEIQFVPNRPDAVSWAEQNGGKRIW